MSILRELLDKAVELGASDIHLKPGQMPLFRISSRIVDSGFEALSPEDLLRITREILPPYLVRSFEEKHEADFSLYEDGVGRFRVNLFVSFGIPSVVMRHVRGEIPTFDSLRLPSQMNLLSKAERGIILMAGITGSGKSTTLAAIIGEINRSERRRIITVEDPIEYMFDDEQSVISQREVGLDTDSYEAALRHLLRQDPDVILIGEMRDVASIRTGLLAAETGHLVLSTIHASNAASAIPRALEVFPLAEQDQVRMSISETLHAIACQRLIPDVHGGVVPAVEIMFNTPTVKKMIQRNELDRLGAAIETGTEDHMQTFNQAIYHLIKDGLISEEDGMTYATNPQALKMNLQGIFLDEGKRILT